MVGPLLESKTRVPSGRGGDVARPRLTERLEAASRQAVTLVSAPAGFGKSTILAHWLAEAGPDGPAVAWVSLDRRDADPSSFWAYVVRALATAAPLMGDSAVEQVRPPGGTPTQVVAALLADLDALPHDVLLVMDDYHLAEGGEVSQGMALLLEHQPRQLHLVIASRSDPTLSLAGLRSRGQLAEVRAADLRFTAGEARDYLNGLMGLGLTDGDIAVLDGRAEGWIAALQLAALSVQGREDASAFIAGFAGDDRYIVDYLVEEVLSRQSPELRDFLLETSILDRLSGPLCDAVTGRPGGRATLVTLERANLFLVPLDDRREWWRYHHLFADVLQAHLSDERGEVVASLHGRASDWFGQHDAATPAVEHAMLAGDVDRAADLMELAIPELSRERREAEFQAWVLALPDEVVAVRPVLGVALAGALAQVSAFDTVGHRLDVVERSLRATDDDPWPNVPPPGLIVNDPEGFRRLPGMLTTYRSALALSRGDLTGAVAHAQAALALAGPDDFLFAAAAGALGGLAAWSVGDLDAAHAAYTQTVTGLRRAGNTADVLGCSITLADIRSTQGRLDDALDTYRRALDLAASTSTLKPCRGTADMHVGVAGVLLERGDESGAAEQLAIAERLGEANGLPQNPYRRRLLQARLRAVAGDLDGALALVDDAERVYVGDYSPNVRPVPAVRARLLIRRGELDRARAWADDVAIGPDDELAYVREFEHVTLARLLLAEQGNGLERGNGLDAAIALLERLSAAADGGGRHGTHLDVLVLLAPAHLSRGDMPAALAALQRAVTLGQEAGYRRVFADEGPSMARLLTTLSKKRGSTAYVRSLIAACGNEPEAPTSTTPLVVALSDREMDVLRLLASDLGGPEIARQLSVSLNTLRTHTKNIYTKLDVPSRRTAVRRAHDLDVL